MFFLLESFIEVSDEEFTQEDVQPKTEDRGTPEAVQEVGRRSEDALEDAPASLIQKDKKSQTEDEGLGERTERGSSSPPAVNTWEPFDAVSTERKKRTN